MSRQILSTSARRRRHPPSSDLKVPTSELRRREGPPSAAPYSSCERKGNPCVDFLMVIMASSIARGRVRTTTESRNMAAILQKRGCQRHKPWVCCVLLWYWTIMLRSIDTCQNRVSSDQYHVAISRAQGYSSTRPHFLKLTADQVIVFYWIAGSCQVNLLRQGRIVLKPD